MKLIHTSDWHLGHQLYSYGREEEQQDMLRQIEGIIKEEQPDALLISGDLFHTAQPSTASQKMFTDAIVRMHDACPSMYIIITAGNHDSGSKHEIFKTPWESLRVFMVGQLCKSNLADHIIRIKDKGTVIAIPYINSRNLPEDFYSQVCTLAKEEDNLPTVLMAHTTVCGADWTGHESSNEKSIGGIDSIALGDFGSGWDYLALGHIHHAQWIQGSSNSRARYSGTPLPVSFDEAFRHTVSIVEISEAGASPQVKEIEIENLRPLVTLPLDGALPWEEALESLRNFIPAKPGCYIRLRVQSEGFLPPTADAQARELAQALACRFCLIQISRDISEVHADVRTLTADELQNEEPEDIARRYAEDKGITWDEDMSDMFKEVLSLLEEELRNE